MPRLFLPLLLTAVLTGACGGISPPNIDPPSDPENERLVGALTTFVGTLERGDYAAARALMCPEPEGVDLAAEFEPHPRPWKQAVTYTGRSGGSGDANLDLTPAGAPVVKYTFSLKKLPDGSWQVCDARRGSTQFDVE